MLRKKLVPVILLPAVIFLLSPRNAYAMHIMEGLLPLSWCLLWGAATLLFSLPVLERNWGGRGGPN